MHLGVGVRSNINKPDFFFYSSPDLYKSSTDLSLISSVALSLKKRKIIFNFKKVGKSLALIILAVVIKSICQYYLGAQETSLEKILGGLDYRFYQGCFLGGILLSFFQDNWNNMWGYFHKSIIIRLDSEDEDSGNEALKNNPKGKDKLTDSNVSKVPDKEKSIEQVTSKKVSSSGSAGEIQTSREELLHRIATYSLAAHDIAKDTKEYSNNFLALAEGFKRFNTLDLGKLNMNNKNEVEKFFIPLLTEQGSCYSKYQSSLTLWIRSRAINLQPENKTKVMDAIANMEIAREKYLSAISNVSIHQDATTQAKVYYAALNEQRNSVNKELNKANDIILKDLKASPFCTTNHDDCKNLVRTLKDYSNAKKEFNIQDSNLKKKLGEVINRRN